MASSSEKKQTEKEQKEVDELDVYTQSFLRYVYDQQMLPSLASLKEESLKKKVPSSEKTKVPAIKGTKKGP
jgi:hypothetical protein